MPTQPSAINTMTSTNLPLMVSLVFALQRAGNTMKNTMLRKSFKKLGKIAD
jgi:hypothetical protein